MLPDVTGFQFQQITIITYVNFMVSLILSYIFTFICPIIKVIIYNNLGSTALYGLRSPLSEVTGSCAFVAVGDRPTGRAAVLSILM